MNPMRNGRRGNSLTYHGWRIWTPWPSTNILYLQEKEKVKPIGESPTEKEVTEQARRDKARRNKSTVTTCQSVPRPNSEIILDKLKCLNKINEEKSKMNKETEEGEDSNLHEQQSLAGWDAAELHLSCSLSCCRSTCAQARMFPNAIWW